jgi:hypothetical protein
MVDVASDRWGSMMAAVVLAHAKWLVGAPGSFATDWHFLFQPASLLPLTAAGVAAASWPVVVRRLPVRMLAVLDRTAGLQPLVPRLLSLLLGMSLVALAVGGRFVAPQLSVAGVTAGPVFLLAEAAVGLWLLSGVLVPLASAAAGALGLTAVLMAGPSAALELAHVFGLAFFLCWMAPTATPRKRQPGQERVSVALRVLRVSLGVALVAAAFTEKLANPALAAAVLQSHPTLEVFALVGLDVSTATYIRIVGAVEALLGLLFVSGVAARVVALMAALPFLASVPLGWVELVGHLPIFAALLALLAYGSPVRPASDSPSAGEWALVGNSSRGPRV